jgi:hypothetical protein
MREEAEVQGGGSTTGKTTITMAGGTIGDGMTMGIGTEIEAKTGVVATIRIEVEIVIVDDE